MRIIDPTSLEPSPAASGRITSLSARDRQGQLAYWRARRPVRPARSLQHCTKCSLTLTPAMMRRHLGHGHRVWNCIICSGVIKRWIRTAGLPKVCSRRCRALAVHLGHCDWCLKPPAPDVLDRRCSACEILAEQYFDRRHRAEEFISDAGGDISDEIQAIERAQWLPVQYHGTPLWHVYTNLEEEYLDEEAA